MNEHPALETKLAHTLSPEEYAKTHAFQNIVYIKKLNQYILFCSNKRNHLLNCEVPKNTILYKLIASTDFKKYPENLRGENQKRKLTPYANLDINPSRVRVSPKNSNVFYTIYQDRQLVIFDTKTKKVLKRTPKFGQRNDMSSYKDIKFLEERWVITVDYTGWVTFFDLLLNELKVQQVKFEDWQERCNSFGAIYFNKNGKEYIEMMLCSSDYHIRKKNYLVRFYIKNGIIGDYEYLKSVDVAQKSGWTNYNYFGNVVVIDASKASKGSKEPIYVCFEWGQDHGALSYQLSEDGEEIVSLHERDCFHKHGVLDQVEVCDGAIYSAGGVCELRRFLIE